MGSNCFQNAFKAMALCGRPFLLALVSPHNVTMSVDAKVSHEVSFT